MLYHPWHFAEIEDCDHGTVLFVDQCAGWKDDARFWIRRKGLDSIDGIGV